MTKKIIILTLLLLFIGFLSLLLSLTAFHVFQFLMGLVHRWHKGVLFVPLLIIPILIAWSVSKFYMAFWNWWHSYGTIIALLWWSTMLLSIVFFVFLVIAESVRHSVEHANHHPSATAEIA